MTFVVLPQWQPFVSSSHGPQSEACSGLCMPPHFPMGWRFVEKNLPLVLLGSLGVIAGIQQFIKHSGCIPPNVCSTLGPLLALS